MTISSRVNFQREEVERILHLIENDVCLVPDKLVNWWSNYFHKHYSRYLDVLSFLENKGEKILEIGSVPGYLTIVLKVLGYDIYGVDIAPERVNKIWEKYSVLVMKVDVKIEPLPYPSNTFDTVLCTEVLEHLRINPLYTFHEMQRVLKPGGRVILSTPNITPIHRLSFLLGKDYQGNPIKEFKKLENLGHMGHIRLYSVREVIEFFNEVNLKVCSYIFKRKTVANNWKHKILLSFQYLHPSLCRKVYFVAEKE